MEQKNIKLDFTSKNAFDLEVQAQELAVMPAILAKKLLKQYSDNLQRTSQTNIINSLINELQAIKNNDALENGRVAGAVEVCANFIQERTLIEHCSNENWDVFAVSQPIAPLLD